MTFQRICALQALACLPLLACAAEKADADSFTAPVTMPATATLTDTATTSASTGDSTDGSSTSTDAGTSTTATLDESTTDGDTTVSGMTGATTGGGETFGVDTTTGGETTGDSSTGGPAGLSWALDVYPVVIAPSCGCHAKDYIGGLLMMDAANAYMNLVNHDSSGSDLLRVKPGDPDASYVLHKLRGDLDNGMGQPMPPAGQMLPKDKIDLFEQWILEGALP